MDVNKFEHLWSQVSNRKVVRPPFYYFGATIKQWYVIDYLRVGPKGGITEIIQLYDHSEAVRENRLKLSEELIYDGLFYDLVELRGTIKSSKKKVETAHSQAMAQLNKVFDRVKTRPDDVASDIAYFLVGHSTSIHTISVGHHGQGKRN